MPDLIGANGQRDDFRIVGKPNITGLTSYAMATGIAKYGADYTVPGMLYAKFLRSPYAHARLLSVDDAEAKKILNEHIDVLHACAALLVEKERITKDEFEALFTQAEG